MTVTILLVLVAVLAALLFLMLGAQVEMYRDLQQLRDHAGLIDRPTPIDLGTAVGARPSEFGLPAHLDSALGAVVAVLSDKCATCRSIAASLDRSMPSDLALVINPGGVAYPDLVTTYTLDPDRTLIDHEEAVSDKLGLKVTPAGIVIENGRLTRATTLPSSRQLYHLLESVRAVRRADGTRALQPSGRNS
jgi:hypothetical protein